MSESRVVVLLTSDGVRLSGRYWSRVAPDQPGYVIAHGFTGTVDTPRVQRICTALAAGGAAVVAADFRGHGRSGGRSSVGRHEVRDVAAAVAWLRSEGVERVITAGWSMGGTAVLRYAGLGGDADAVVSVSSPGHWFERGTQPMRVLHWAAETRTGRVTTRLARRTRLARPWAELPESPVEVVGAIAPTPLLIVHGDADHYFPARHGRLLAAAAPGADFWLEPGMGHAENATTPDLVDRIDRWARDAVGSPTQDGLRR